MKKIISKFSWLKAILCFVLIACGIMLASCTEKRDVCEYVDSEESYMYVGQTKKFEYQCEHGDCVIGLDYDYGDLSQYFSINQEENTVTYLKSAKSVEELDTNNFYIHLYCPNSDFEDEEYIYEMTYTYKVKLDDKLPETDLEDYYQIQNDKTNMEINVDADGVYYSNISVKVKENSNLNVNVKYYQYNSFEFALTIDFLNGVKTIEEDVEIYYYDNLIDTFKVYYDDFTLELGEEAVHMYIDETYQIPYEKSGLSEPVFELYDAYDLVSGDFIDVTEDGVITSKAYGVAKVKVTYGSIEKILNVYIDPYDIDVDDYYSIYTGETLKFNWECDFEGFNPTYSSKNESVLTINEDGFMTGIAKGESYVSLTFKGHEYSVLVRVLESRFIGADNMHFLLEDESPKKVELIYEGYINEEELTYKSTNENALIVDNDGNVTLIGEGTGYIITTYKGVEYGGPNGVYGSLFDGSFTVKHAFVSELKGPWYVNSGESITLEHNGALLPKFESSDESIATVSKDGVVTGISGGLVTIKASLGITSVTKEIYVLGENLGAENAEEFLVRYIKENGKTETIQGKYTPLQLKYLNFTYNNRTYKLYIDPHNNSNDLVLLSSYNDIYQNIYDSNDARKNYDFTVKLYIDLSESKTTFAIDQKNDYSKEEWSTSTSFNNLLSYKEGNNIEFTNFYSDFFNFGDAEKEFINYSQDACEVQLDEALKALSDYLSKEFGFTAKEFGFINY